MTAKNITPERDRETTERRILDTIGQMISENGFEKIGINAVATQSGVSKILIYRYFGSVEGLMATYIRQHDFWINFPQELPERNKLPEYLKQMFRSQIEQLRRNPTLRRLHRWELSSDNEIIVRLREQRENAGMQRIKRISELTGYPLKELEVLASVLTASITYLVMLEEFCPVYNGIPLNNNSGWEQITQGIDSLIDKVFQV
ncbi:TetR/AcrR family transcriptional regulator [Bacteroides oleiciplenus]|uniref:TetR/AcrR family transcriptional regulator n=1 Tax=Bacteroides oleiciplenus TaxID=626931 RepID=A0A3E5BAV5_9BACE|nr:TetR/AcrR family transcriptional regulator [Bacteroides oleiciplenus]RGN34663.1 TetR/AcrR family transcriptional regulator [Bacteroides oleiciplenus]